MKTLAVIPARYGSTRLPGKALLPVGGVPLVVRVLRQVLRCRRVDRVVVATDDRRIAEAVEAEGREALLTPSDLPTGGDRVAYVARRTPDYDLVLNVQVDDPLVGPDLIDPLVEALEKDPSSQLAVLAKRIDREEEIDSPHVVKVVFDQNGRALYFSRSRIPYPRTEHRDWYKHIGPYAYRRAFLLEFASWEPTPLERAESLEMLRVLERGHAIRCVPAERDTIEIDTPEDVRALEEYLAREGDEVRG